MLPRPRDRPILRAMDTLDLNLLVTLDALLAEGSVTRAAARMGLSPPAMSHALARIREQLGDPILVRAGREMVLTPRALELQPRLRALIDEARVLLLPSRAFDPAALDRDFRIHATDHILTVLGPALDELARDQAPRVTLRFLPTAPDDAQRLREGHIDLAVGIYGELPPELRTRHLMTDRFVCVVRADHPILRDLGKAPRRGPRRDPEEAPSQPLTLERFVAMEHIQIAPRGVPGGYLDDLLAERGLKRRVARAVPYFLAALLLTAETDYILTVSARVAKKVAPRLGLRLLEPPLLLQPYALSLLWHPRMDGDLGHRWLRELLIRAVAVAAPDVDPAPRTRLDPPRRPRPG